MSISNGSTKLAEIEEQIDERRQRIADLADDLASRLQPADMLGRAAEKVATDGLRAVSSAIEDAMTRAPLAVLGAGAAAALIGARSREMSRDLPADIETHTSLTVDAHRRRRSPDLVASGNAKATLPASSGPRGKPERWLVPAGLFAVACVTATAYLSNRR